MSKTVAIRHQNEIYDQTFIVNWCLGNTCNYACSYCPDDLHDGSSPWLPLEKVIGFCDKVIDQYKVKWGQRLFFEFTGGEVTLYKGFLPLIQHLKQREALVSIISNGSRRMEFWEKAYPYLDHICLSFHSESANVEHFKSVVQFLSKKISVHVNIMMLPEKFDLCRELAHWVSRETQDVTLAVQPLLVNFGSRFFPYTDEQMQFLKTGQPPVKLTKEPVKYRGALYKILENGERRLTTGQQLVSSGENNWKGWKCWVGVKQLVVDFSGNVYRGWCFEGGKLGNVNELESIKFPTEPIRCRKSFCHCILDVMNRREETHPVASAELGASL